MPKFRYGLARWLALASALGLCACSHAHLRERPTDLDDPMLAGLERAASWPQVDPTLQLSLAVRYLAGPHALRGREFFSAQAERAPNDARLLALVGLLTVASAEQVPLVRRKRWVERGLADLDRAVAKGDPMARYFRGVVGSRVPAMFGRAEQARDDLQAVERRMSAFPPGLRRELLAARSRLGDEQAASSQPDGRWPMFTDYTVDRVEGFRFVPRAVTRPAPNVLVVRGHDFADFAFIVTDAGVVAIDAGTSRNNARAAIDVLRKHTDAPITHLVLTHAHWDHVGGASVFVEAGAQVIAQERFAQNIAALGHGAARYPFFFGRHGHSVFDVDVDRAVGAPETLLVGNVELSLIPVVGGETDDALLVHLPRSGVMFVGDCFMPYFGAPFIGEGSPEALLGTLEVIRAKRPRVLVHGHAPLTDLYRAEYVPALEAALARLVRTTLADIAGGRSVSEALARNLVPQALQTTPGAVLPYLLWREHAIKRLYQRRDGYWHAGGAGMETVHPRAFADALDTVASGRPRRLVIAIDRALDRGDFALAWRLAEMSLVAHPGHAGLVARRKRALAGLRARHQSTDPFKFIIYSQWADLPLPRIGSEASP